MQAKALARFVRMSDRKLRRVADLVRGKKVPEALRILHFTPKYAAVPLEKTINSATANVLNLEGTAKLKAEDLFVKEIYVNGGPTLKRIRAVGMGRAYRIRKRTAHITVTVAETPEKLKAKAQELQKLAEKTKAPKVAAKPKTKKVTKKAG